MQVRAFFDRLVSRCIGAVVRSIMIVLGGLTLVVQSIFSVVAIVIWAFIPLLPFIGALLAFIGWVPRWI